MIPPGAEVCKAGITDIDGKLPVNTGGGLMSFGHPVGATGVKQVRLLSNSALNVMLVGATGVKQVST
jgi:hypothetical protein